MSVRAGLTAGKSPARDPRFQGPPVFNPAQARPAAGAGVQRPAARPAPPVYRPAPARTVLPNAGPARQGFGAPPVYNPYATKPGVQAKVAVQPFRPATAIQPARWPGVVQRMRNTFFDASPFATGLNAAYDATQTHFTYLDDNEINGTGQAWLAGPNENLHVTIQNTAHSVVAHYFYNRLTHTWRHHLYGGGALPYGFPAHGNLQLVLQRAIDFAWPPGNVTFVTAPSKTAKKKPVKKKMVGEALPETDRQREAREKREAEEQRRLWLKTPEGREFTRVAKLKEARLRREAQYAESARQAAAAFHQSHPAPLHDYSADYIS